MREFITNNRLHFIATLKDNNDVEAVLRALDTLGFTLQRIRTGGEHSSHDCTYSFKHEYASYADFVANAHRDFAEETERYKSAAEMDWSHTSFDLAQPADLHISLFMRKKEACHDCPDTTYLGIDKKGVADEDKTFFDQVMAAVGGYLKK